MKVVVTGGTGFVGRHLAWRLAGEGCEVVFCGRDPRAAEQVQRLAPAPMRFVALDHGSADAARQLSEAAAGAAALVHCAALSAPWGSAEAFRRANLDSTREVIQACRTREVGRLVHLSTPSLYFDFRDRLGIREDEPLPPPVNRYAQTKGEAEALLQAADVAPAVVLRPRAIFGPWDATLMPRMLRVMRRGAIPLMRGGRAELSAEEFVEILNEVGIATETFVDFVRAGIAWFGMGPTPIKARQAEAALVGHMVSSLDRISVGGKSPLTGGIKEANAGGNGARDIARLGIKAIVVEGQPADDGSPQQPRSVFHGCEGIQRPLCGRDHRCPSHPSRLRRRRPLFRARIDGRFSQRIRSWAFSTSGTSPSPTDSSKSCIAWTSRWRKANSSCSSAPPAVASRLCSA